MVFDALDRFLTFFWLGHKNAKNGKNRQKTCFLVKVVKKGHFLVKNPFLGGTPPFLAKPSSKIDKKVKNGNLSWDRRGQISVF